MTTFTSRKQKTDQKMKKQHNKPAILTGVFMITVLMTHILLYSHWPYLSEAKAPIPPSVESRPAGDSLKMGPETLSHPADTNIQSNAHTAIAPNGYHAAVWVETSPRRGIFYTLWDVSHNIIVERQRIDNDGVINDDDNPSISFFKDNAGANTGRFIIAWQQSQPTCYTENDTSGVDIYYREINSSGVPEGNCESKLSPLLENSGNQTKPDIAAGYYDRDGEGVTEDIFAVTYLNYPSNGNPTIEAVYHENTTHVLQTVSSCEDCDFPQVDINSLDSDPLVNRLIYTWNENQEGTMNIFLRQATNASLMGSVEPLSSAKGSDRIYADGAFITDNQFVVTYTEYKSIEKGIGHINLQTYSFNENGIPNMIGDPIQVDESSDKKNSAGYAKVASDNGNGSFLIVWTDFPATLEDNDIYGKFYTVDSSNKSSVSEFGSAFKINSTQAGSQTLPSVDLNDFGQAIVGWEGNFENNTDTKPTSDNQGIIVQTLANPLYNEPHSELQPEARQEVRAGGRTLTVPNTINFPSATVNTSMASEVAVSVRDDHLVTPNCDSIATPCIEFEDLDGVPSVITVSTGDFTLESDGKTYIYATDMGVKNCDADVSTDPSCIVTLYGNEKDFTLDPSTSDDNSMPPGSDIFYTFGSDTEQKTLATKNGSLLGKWRFFPKFQLTIPAITPPGNHSGTITFSLT